MSESLKDFPLRLLQSHTVQLRHRLYTIAQDDVPAVAIRLFGKLVEAPLFAGLSES